jgi:flagellar assembly protein FliH
MKALSSKTVISAGETAFQRWELGSLNPLDQPAPAQVNRPEVPEPQAEAGSQDHSEVTAPTEALYPTAEELEKLHQQAWQEGHDAGYGVGFSEGEVAGREAAAEAVNRFHALASQFEQVLIEHEQRLAAQVVTLTLEISRQVLRTQLQLDPSLLLPVVREALGSLPALGQAVRLFVHPDDEALLKSFLREEFSHLQWRIVDDMNLQPGGVRIDAVHGELDASLPARWQRIVSRLGQDSDWLNGPLNPPSIDANAVWPADNETSEQTPVSASGPESNESGLADNSHDTDHDFDNGSGHKTDQLPADTDDAASDSSSPLTTSS